MASRTSGGTSLRGSGWITPSKISGYLDSVSPGNINMADGARAASALDLLSVTSDYNENNE